MQRPASYERTCTAGRGLLSSDYSNLSATVQIPVCIIPGTEPCLSAMRKILVATLFALSLSAHASEQSKTAKFLWISDLHFNPMADPMLVKELDAAEAARWEPILERTLPASYSMYGSDTNWWLLKSALQQFP